MEIKILGPGCAKCEKAADIVNEVISEMNMDTKIEKVTDMLEIAGYGVLGTPAVVIDGTVKCSGKVPKKKEVQSWIAK